MMQDNYLEFEVNLTASLIQHLISEGINIKVQFFMKINWQSPIILSLVRLLTKPQTRCLDFRFLNSSSFQQNDQQAILFEYLNIKIIVTMEKDLIQFQVGYQFKSDKVGSQIFKHITNEFILPAQINRYCKKSNHMHRQKSSQGYEEPKQNEKLFQMIDYRSLSIAKGKVNFLIHNRQQFNKIAQTSNQFRKRIMLTEKIDNENKCPKELEIITGLLQLKVIGKAVQQEIIKEFYQQVKSDQQDEEDSKNQQHDDFEKSLLKNGKLVQFCKILKRINKY